MWDVINGLRAATDVDRLLIGNDIMEKYIGPCAVMEVNVDPGTKADILDGLSSGFLPPTVCDKWQATLEKEMAGDIMPRFVASPAWKSRTQPLPPPSVAAVVPLISSHERQSVLQRIATWKSRGAGPSTSSDRAYDRLRFLQARVWRVGGTLIRTVADWCLVFGCCLSGPQAVRTELDWPQVRCHCC
jgi:hypothetical protein